MCGCALSFAAMNTTAFRSNTSSTGSAKAWHRQCTCSAAGMYWQCTMQQCNCSVFDSQLLALHQQCTDRTSAVHPRAPVMCHRSPSFRGDNESSSMTIYEYEECVCNAFVFIRHWISIRNNRCKGISFDIEWRFVTNDVYMNIILWHS